MNQSSSAINTPMAVNGSIAIRVSVDIETVKSLNINLQEVADNPLALFI